MISSECSGCEYQCKLSHIDICTLGSPCPHQRSTPMTNEEWFCSLSTEEKAKVLRRRTYGNSEDNETVEQGWVNWLKAKHEDNPPDIPSVPSWDKWLQGEKTKCELCDGSGEWVECNLVGRFECPKTPKTEQEYLQTCNTEQLAEWICSVHEKCYYCGAKRVSDREHCPFGDGKCRNNKHEFAMWLKQPHHEKE